MRYAFGEKDRSKRQRLREHDLAWDWAEEGETTGVADQSAREDGDGESAWTSSSSACSPTEGHVLEHSEAMVASITANPLGAVPAAVRQERLEASEQGATTLENFGMIQERVLGNAGYRSTGNQEMQHNAALAGSQQQQEQQEQEQQPQGTFFLLLQFLQQRERVNCCKNYPREGPGGGTERGTTTSIDDRLSLCGQDGGAAAGTFQQARQFQQAEQIRERMHLDEQRTDVLEQAVGALRAPGVTGCPYAGKLEEMQQELASTLERTEAMRLQLEDALALQHVEGQAALGRVSRGKEVHKNFNGEIREQLRQGVQQMEGLKVTVRWLQERSYAQDALEQSVAATSSEIVDVRKVLHEAESTLQINLSEIRVQLRQDVQQTEGLTGNLSEVLEVAEGLRAQKQAMELLETAGRELQVGTVQGLERLTGTLQHEHERREEGCRNMHGAWVVEARRQQFATEALAVEAAQHDHLLEGFVGAVCFLQVNRTEQEAALATMDQRMAAMLNGYEEQALLVRALTAHVRAVDTTMAELSNRAQAAERDVRGAEGRAEHWARCADDAFQLRQRRQDRQASYIATNSESCARVEQGLAILRQDARVDIMALNGMPTPLSRRGVPKARLFVGVATWRAAYLRGEKRGRRVTVSDLTTGSRAAQGTSSNALGTAGVDLTTESRAAQGTSSNASGTAG
ncbi:hypothetical protein T484DRAFT_3632797, partial [Baffinella frigidus]